MYFDDLTPYTYFPPCPSGKIDYMNQRLIKAFGVGRQGLRLLNFGWLDPSHPFPTGDILLDEVEKLVTLSRKHYNLTRGFHTCRFCRQSREAQPQSQDEEYNPLIVLRYKSQEIGLGSSEIWIKAESNTVYIAPTLVLHYIAEHSYRVPDEVKVALREIEGIVSF